MQKMGNKERIDWQKVNDDFENEIKSGKSISDIMIRKPNPDFHQMNPTSKTKHFKRR